MAKKPTPTQLKVLRDVKEHENRGERVWNSGNEMRYHKETVRILVFERGWLEEYPNMNPPMGYRVRLTPAGRAVLGQYKEG